MYQCEDFGLDPTKSRYKMGSKFPDSPSIDASPGKNHLFETTDEDHVQQKLHWTMGFDNCTEY